MTSPPAPAHRTDHRVASPAARGQRDLRRLAVVATAVLAVCGLAAAEPADPQREPPRPPAFVSPSTVRYHMARHVDQLRAIERLLLEGDLEEAKAIAFLLAKPEADPGIAPWMRESDETVRAARGLAAARTVEEALQFETRVAAGCAACHLSAQRLPQFAPPPPLPPDVATPVARMARHQWAVDRLWEGMVGNDDERWRRALDVLAATPPPFAFRTVAPSLAAGLRERAQQALAARTVDTLDARAAEYGEMLATCAACHRLVRRAVAR